MTGEDRAALHRGMRIAIPYATAGFLLSASFGVLAREAGMPAIAAVVMSAIVFAGSAQFASLSIIAAGGGVGAAVLAGTLMNSRFLPMGVALAPSLPGNAAERAVQGQPLVDASWALANRGDGTFDRWMMFGSSLSQYVTWTTGTVVGVLLGGALPDAHSLGLDAIFPAFFLALLIGELKDGRSRGVALAGALVALSLVPIAPPGIPILVASLVALVGATGIGRRPGVGA